MNLPISLSVQSLAKAMLARAGMRSRFHLMIEALMGEIEDATSAATDCVMVFDRSGSMGDPLGDSGASIMDEVKAAAEKVIESLSPQDRIGLVQFDGSSQKLLPLTQCDERGKIEAVNTLYAIGLGGATNFQPALEDALSMFQRDPGRKRAILFFTDGANSSGSPNPLPATEAIGEAGISLFIGGLGVQDSGEQLLEQMAGIKFRSLDNADDVADFFAESLTKATSAMVTNALIRVRPVNFVATTDFELVTRGGGLNYVPASSETSVPIGEISQKDQFQFYLGLELKLPDDIAPGRRSFGQVELVGDVPSQGLVGETLARTYIAVHFSENPVPGVNSLVKNLMHLAGTAREVAAAAKSESPEEMHEHLEEARKTVAFSDDEVAAALKAQMEQIQETLDRDPEAARKQARRATKGFSAQEAAEALKNMGQ